MCVEEHNLRFLTRLGLNELLSNYPWKTKSVSCEPQVRLSFWPFYCNTFQAKTDKLRPINFYVNFYPILCHVYCKVRDMHDRWRPCWIQGDSSGVQLHEYVCRFGFGMVCDESSFFLWNIWHSVLTERRSQATWTTCSFHCVATNNAAIFT